MITWNGQAIADMTLRHIENTIILLEKRAKQTCTKCGGSDWKLYVNATYFDLKLELQKRDSVF